MASTAISMAYSETRAHALIRGCMLCSSRGSDAVRAGIFPRGEVAEPGLRRTPGERGDSKGARGVQSPPPPPLQNRTIMGCNHRCALSAVSRFHRVQYFCDLDHCGHHSPNL